ncbi:NAD(P)/FAD-dependent oxidoreductase [Actinomycetospora endophytica]|uniref:NAD(P)/FAD-dependent oxidoreductase n=1 Tax=Actinomycetospora endophytica TaxID=2291215 RepID=A0ABS8P9E8_9PSEU|nr:NAD(P)/FAD-dependent oxidoreductase [Actinomycetospora endophytica]MCD2194638.1 NAD(P)/FAD-dependent oxidoreductase [Actinomycetospora endophytica]
MTEPWDVVVVGAGIAGLTAARTCAEQGLRTVAHDMLAPGGRLISLGAVRAWPPSGAGAPNGPEFAGALLEDAMTAGVEIAYGEVTGLRTGPAITLDTAEGPAEARAVVVATGLAPDDAAIPNAAAWEGRGLSECASCDGPLHAGNKVVVLGGDEWSATEALELAGVAAHVTVVAGTTTWSAAAEREVAASAAIEVRRGVAVTGLEGPATLAAVHLDDGTTLEASGLFTAAATRPRLALLDAANGDPRVLAAGDVAVDTEIATPTLLAAAADGRRAGLAVVTLLATED